MNYNFTTNLFRYKSNDKQIGECHRIYFICDFEDPNKYVLKLKEAFKNRAFMDSLLRYNYYIDNMSKNDLNGLMERQVKSIQMYFFFIPNKFILLKDHQSKESE